MGRLVLVVGLVGVRFGVVRVVARINHRKRSIGVDLTLAAAAALAVGAVGTCAAIRATCGDAVVVPPPHGALLVPFAGRIPGAFPTRDGQAKPCQSNEQHAHLGRDPGILFYARAVDERIHEPA
jgi:hypothetical protein